MHGAQDFAPVATRADDMGGSTSGDDRDDRVHWRDEEELRIEFRAAGHVLWLGLVQLLALRWESKYLAHQVASGPTRLLSNLAKLRCRPDGRSPRAGEVFEDLCREVTRGGLTLEGTVQRMLARPLAGQPRSGRGAAEIAQLIEAFLRCYAADCERGELTWVDEIRAWAAPGEVAVSWIVEVPRGAVGAAELVVRISLDALEAAGLQAGDRLVIEPRPGGLWLGRAPGR